MGNHYKGIPILQLTRNDEIIKEWSSAVAAARELNITLSGIYKVLYNKMNTCGGFKWKKKDTPQNYIIIQSSMKGVFIKKWTTIKYINKKLGLDKSCLYKAIKGELKSCGGFKWFKSFTDKPKLKKRFKKPRSRRITKIYEPIIQISLEDKYIKQWPNVQAITDKTGLNPGNLYKAINGKLNTLGGYIWKNKSDYFKDKNNKFSKNIGTKPTNYKLLQKDKKGKLIKEWPGVMLAAKELSLTPSGIRGVLSGKGKTCGGFTWEKILLDMPQIIKSKEIKIPKPKHIICGQNKVIVEQYTMEGEFIKEWESIRTAAKEFNMNPFTISMTINGHQKSSGGYIWKRKIPKIIYKK